MNTLLPLHYVDLSSLFSPLGDVLWRFPEFCCSLLCISFLWEDKRASGPTWTTLPLPGSFREKRMERRTRVSLLLLLLPSNVSLADDGMVQVEFHLNDPSVLQSHLLLYSYLPDRDWWFQGSLTRWRNQLQHNFLFCQGDLVIMQPFIPVV